MLMIENLHPAIKNPEIFPSILLKSINNIVHDFSKIYSGDIKKGCERNFCVLPAMKLTRYLKSKGFPKAKTIKGTFIVDDPRPLSISDFTDEERALAKQQGFYLGDKDNAWQFAVKNNLVDELKNIPHYWTQIGDLIIDFTGETQFVKSGMVQSLNLSRYKKIVKENILTKISDSSYTYIWNKTNENEWTATFRENGGDLIKVNILRDGALNTWLLKFGHNNRYDIPNESNTFKIFYTIIKILKEFVKNVKPDSIIIKIGNSKIYEKSRVNLYSIGLSKIANDINYSFTKSENGKSVEFVLKNKNIVSKESVITELGETSYTFKITHNTIELFSAEFTTDENVKVEFFSKLMKDKITWDVAFSANGSVGLTGGGDQYRILSTILKLMNLFILIKNPKIITFTSDKIKDISNGKQKTTRTNVYKKAMNIISTKHDYSVEIKPLPHTDKFILTKNNLLTEEINSKEITSSLYAKIMSYAERINAADTPNKILSVIRQISKKQALEMSKKHISDIDYSNWIFEFKLHDGAQHKGAIAFNEHGFGLLQIYLSKSLIKKYLTDLKIPEKRDDVFTHFWYDLTRLISHEMLHLEQWLRSKGKQANRKTMLGKLKSESGSVKTDTPENFKHYLSDKLEISAYSLNAVQELIHNNIDINKLYREYILKNNSDIRDFIRLKSPSYNLYYVYFGQNKNNNKDQSIWNLFLKKFTYHLELRVK